jgi:uncharacterized membrane protein
VIAFAALGILPIACSPSSPPVDETPPIEEVAAEPTPPLADTDAVPLRAHAYDCEDGTSLVAEYRAEDVAVFVPGGPVFLPRQPSGSGAKYGDGQVVFWNRGTGLLFGTHGDDGVLVECDENRRRSQIASARLDGAEYWAAGNEPGWTLHVFPDRMVLRTDYGARRIELPTPRPAAGSDGTVLRTTNGDHDLVVTLAGGGCADDMSGERFPLRVRLDLDGTLYRGCGQALH